MFKQETNQISRLDIIIPVRNEAKNLVILVPQIDRVMKKTGINYRLIIVDDRSKDNLLQKVSELSQKYPLVYHLKKGKLGKAFSILEGAKFARTEYVGMIDADGQYPPEAIPEMLKITPQHGIVIAQRKVYKSSLLRRFASRINAFIFGRLLFGLKVDIQSGLKIFRKELIYSIDKRFITPWTFDLPLLFTCKSLGFSLGQVPITYKKRVNGDSKISFLKSALEISIQALKLKFFHQKFFPLPPLQADSSLGAGVYFRKKRYITHSLLPFSQSAMFTLKIWQKIFVLFGISFLFAGLVTKPMLTGISLIAVLSTIYFLDVLFSFYLILKGLCRPPELKSTPEELATLKTSSLPVYSILCPLYKEVHILPQFIKAIEALDWPKDKLDVLLLLEKDDLETIEKIKQTKLPDYFRLVEVPYSQPKTKPKACNYGLGLAKGEYLVIYDAEDKPDPMQLKKAYLGFQKVNPQVACLQAKLNYYNSGQNLLTKLFTAEYSLWFDIILPGLQSINTTIPLGGTSNHFRTKQLKKLAGWDAFNVTEDCDLGVRLFNQGYKTAIIHSVTLEEANSNLKNWIRQRSRWIKGYFQTYLVHMHNPWLLFKKQGWHALIFQLIIGLKVSFILINPLLWLTTIAYFGAYSIVGPTIEQLFPRTVFYMAAFALIFGNFMYLYNYMIGCAKQKHWTIIKYIFLIPFYWLAMGIGALVALFQLIFRPYFWEKTIHGLYLKKLKERKAASSLLAISHAQPSRINFLTKLKHPIIKTGSLLIFASILANFFNFLYNAYLGRQTNLDEFGLISLFSNILFINQVFTSSLSQTVTHRTAYLFGRYNIAAKSFWRAIRSKTLIITVALTVLWLILTPFLAAFFRTQNILPFVLFTPVLAFSLISAVDSGFLSGNLKFANLALLAAAGPLIKFLTAFGFVQAQKIYLVYSAIPLATLITFVFGWLMAKKIKEKTKVTVQEQLHFPKKFMATSLLAGLATTAFLSLDVILVKHFLPPLEAGYYALLALSGKMIYFAGGLFNAFVNPLISKTFGAGKNTKKVFANILILNIGISVLGFLGIGLYGHLTLPLLFGNKISPILEFLPFYCLGIAGFTIANCIILYHQARKEYLFSVLSFSLSLVQVWLIVLFHSNLFVISEVVAGCGVIFLITILFLHLFYHPLFVFLSNIIDFLGLFGRLKKPVFTNKDALRILIFNWRDTKHKWAGGAEVYVQELSKRWVKMGHQVTLFCGNDGHCLRNDVKDGVKIIRRGGFYTVYIWAFLYYIFKLRRQYNVIIDCENGLPFFTPLYVRKPIFLVIHHIHQEIFREHLKKPFSWMAMSLEKRVMPLVYKNKQIITISQSSKKSIIRLKISQKEPVVIQSGVNLQQFMPAKKAEKPLIAYIGRLKAYKNLPVLLQAAKQLSKKLIPFEVHIAGFGEEIEFLKQLVNQYKLTDQVKFLGKISQEEKIRLYQKAWVFVNPSTMEGWGITSIEANACGTPVVASNVPGLRDSVNNPHSGFLVNYQNPSEFCEMIFRIITNKRLREDLSITSREWAEKFTWERSAEACLKIFKS